MPSLLTMVSAVTLGLTVSACGGGGGGINGTPPPPLTGSGGGTPTPSTSFTEVNFDRNVLQSDRDLQGSAVQSAIDLASSTQTVHDSEVQRDTIAIGYDPGSGTYQLSFAGAAQSFGRQDRESEVAPGSAHYSKVGSMGESQFLTIYSLPFISGSFATDLDYNQYVAQGHWQVNQVGAGGAQSTRFTSFVFGLPTAPSDVPTTGAAHWLIDIFGALAIEDQEILTISGSGDLEVDFGAGAFQVNSFVNETEFLSLGGTTGSLHFVSGGRLGSDGTFGGAFAYRGTVALEGSLEGAFFGPGAAEVGATFEAENANATLSGAFTGQRSQFGSTSDGVKNISLTSPITTGQRLFGDGTSVTQRNRSTEPNLFNVSIGSGASIVFDYDPSEADRIADPSGNFDRFARFGSYNSGGDKSDLEYAFYKVGDANSEVALTYLTFAIAQYEASETVGAETFTEDYHGFRHWGYVTSPYLVDAMTGSATYRGVVYGRAAGPDGFAADVGGTSLFDVDFSNGVYSGQLVMNGTAVTGGSVDFGTWTFDGQVGEGMQSAELLNGIPAIGTNEIRPVLYGPNGEEIGAAFQLTTQERFDDPDFYEIAGVTVAKQD